jgi:hypothetical protein
MIAPSAVPTVNVVLDTVPVRVPEFGGVSPFEMPPHAVTALRAKTSSALEMRAAVLGSSRRKEVGIHGS